MNSNDNNKSVQTNFDDNDDDDESSDNNNTSSDTDSESINKKNDANKIASNDGWDFFASDWAKVTSDWQKSVLAKK